MNLPLPQSKFGDKYRENFERIFGQKNERFSPCAACGHPIEVGKIYCERPDCQEGGE